MISERRLTLIASVMVIIGPLSLSLYTPAMPSLVRELHTDAAMIKLSLTVYLAGFALAQLLCGPLSDRLGRRLVVLLFSAVYVAGSLLVVASQSVEGLLIGRVVQGVGGCAGVALSRAMVRDCFTGQVAARIMVTIAMFLSIAPALGPIIGSFLLRFSGWHAIFLVMAAYGVLLMALMAATPETNRTPDPQAFDLLRMLANYRLLLGEPVYLRNVAVSALAVGGLYTFHSVTPFVYVDAIGLTPESFALVMLTSAFAFFAGSFVTNRLLRRHEARALVLGGILLTLLGGLGLVAGLQLLPPSVPGVALPVMCWAFGAAMLLPGATVDALAPFPQAAGAASAMMGFLQMAAGVMGTALASAFASSVDALAAVPFAMALLSLVLFALVRPRAARVRAAE
ncbi:multidrug effflux MFS transporter [Geminicoccaceae bacterium 1502E]|nr:multidrug effflux MFS transporter [Geminicoccaceae bacterium 1502E]